MKANEVVRNVVKEKLERNEVVASMTIRLTRGVEIARLAKTAGFDMIYIDLEHSTMTLDATGQICLAAPTVYGILGMVIIATVLKFPFRKIHRVFPIVHRLSAFTRRYDSRVLG